MDSFWYIIYSINIKIGIFDVKIKELKNKNNDEKKVT